MNRRAYRPELKGHILSYTSFKCSEFEGFRGERYFTDFTEETFAVFLRDFPEASIVEKWVSGDVRPGRENEQWLNLILRRS